MKMIRKAVMAAIALGALIGPTSLVHAEMVLSQVIVDLLPGKPPREDIEVSNDGEERLYVVAEPSEMLQPGTPQELRKAVQVGENPGILVSPQRLVLEPHERRIIRVAAMGERPAQDKVYRIAIRPVAGNVSADQTALKVFVGYDALVLVRPAQFTGDIQAERSGRTLILRNDGNTAQELFQGSQCRSDKTDCRVLPAKRLYAGASWEQVLPFDTPVHYRTKIGPTTRDRIF
jgi:P pilus assembly chaperone PapD